MRRGAKPLGMVAGSFWGLLRGPASLPVLFGSRQDAVDNMDTDEYLVQVAVRPASLRDLLKGEQTLIARQRTKAGRPKLPAEQKQRRGSGIKVDVRGANQLVAELKKMAPLMRRRFVDAMNGELSALGLGGKGSWVGADMAKGPDHSAEIKVTRGKVVSHRFIKRAIKKGAKRAAAPRVRR